MTVSPATQEEEARAVAKTPRPQFKTHARPYHESFILSTCVRLSPFTSVR